MQQIRILIVDDSAVVRQVLGALLAADPQIRVIGTAADPIIAMQRMSVEWPDVIVLDIEMPRMDGITFLHKLMAARPTPVVVCSTLTEKGAETTLQALAAGAVTFVTKPKALLKAALPQAGEELIRAVKSAAGANLGGVSSGKRLPSLAPGPAAALAQTTDRVVAIGTSTGGTQALEQVLSRLPRVCPGIVIVQHMPEKFTASFAARLDQLCQLEVREARNGDRVVPGRALIAPGGRQMQLNRSGAQYFVEVLDGPPVNRHRPSVDVLFRSVARYAGRNALGIILTGMGDDGARGLKEMHDAGAHTCAQDEATCVVYGMPKEAVKLGAADRVVPLHAVPEVILAH